MESLYLPKEYVGMFLSGGGITKNVPRKWTKGEIDWALMLQSKGHTSKEIAHFLGRPDHVGVSIKLKRLSKKSDDYNPEHRHEKEMINSEFVSSIQPSSVLDLFAGKKSWYHGKCDDIVSNDMSHDGLTYKMDALKCACMLYASDRKFDIVDLDPFGSAYDCIDLAVKMARKGVVITFGELGHVRFKRIDFVKRHYGISSMSDFTMEKLVSHVLMIGERNKKRLSVFRSKKWRNIGRVWLKVEGKFSITEQWHI